MAPAALLRMAAEEKFPDDLKFTASAELNNVRWPEIKTEAAKLLPLPQGQNAQPLPPIAELLKIKGDPTRGGEVFARETVGCIKCHQVNGRGTDVGPRTFPRLAASWARMRCTNPFLIRAPAFRSDTRRGKSI